MLLFKKKFAEALSEIFDGALSHCECQVCNNKNWFFRHPDVSGLSEIPYEKDEPQKTYTFTCTRCGNIRTHSADIINAALIENDK